MNSDADTLAGRLGQLARRAGSVSALARLCAIPQRTMAGYVSGEREPRISDVVGIAQQAGVPLEWLATGRGPMQADPGAMERVKTPLDPPVHPRPTPSNFDEELMRECIIATIELLDAFDKTLPPAKFAEFVILLYVSEKDERSASGRPLGASNVVQLFKRVS